MTEIRNLGTITVLKNAYDTNNQYGIFADCKNLTKVVLPETLINIDMVTFIGCTSLTDINLDHVVTFGRYAFSNCTSLSLNDLTLTNAQTIHPGAFANVPLTGTLSCPSLTSLPGEAYSIGAFENTNLTEIADLGSITVIPDFRENAETGCFANNQNLIKVTLPETLTFIGRRAFYNCPKLTTCNIPSSVTTINNHAFANTSLSFDEFYLPNLTTLNQNAFYGVKIKKLNLGAVVNLPSASSSTQNYGDKSVLEEVVLSDNLEAIPQYSFHGYTKLSGIMDFRDKNIKTFGLECFGGCTGIEDIYLGESTETLSTLYRYAPFKYSPDGIIRLPNLKTLSSAVFQASLISKVESLGSVVDIGANSGYMYTFYDCPNLEFVCIPKVTTTIRSRVFQKSAELNDIVCGPTSPPSIVSDTFDALETNPFITFYVPKGSREDYIAGTNWGVYEQRIKEADDIMMFPSRNTSFVNSLKLTTVYDMECVTPEYSVQGGNATIDNNGQLTFSSEGNAVVIATYNGESVTHTYRYSKRITQEDITEDDIYVAKNNIIRTQYAVRLLGRRSYTVSLSMASGAPLRAVIHLKTDKTWNGNKYDGGWISAGGSQTIDQTQDPNGVALYIGIGFDGEYPLDVIKQYCTFTIEFND